MDVEIQPGEHTLGVVGLGNMGWPMAAQLRGAGFQVIVYDIDVARANRFAQEHDCDLADGLASLARTSDVVITILPDADVVRHVVFGDGGDALASGLRAGHVLLEMSSSDPTATLALAEQLAKLGVEVVDAPVSGGVPRAVTGELAILVGGDPRSMESLEAVFSCLGTTTLLVGATGAGHAMKALNNLLSAVGLLATAEVLSIGTKFGLDPSVMVDAFNSSTGRNNSTEKKFHQFVLSRTFDSGFGLGLMAKDLRIAGSIAAAAGVPSPLSQVSTAFWQYAETQLPGGADHTEIVVWLESLTGVQLARADAAVMPTEAVDRS